MDSSQAQADGTLGAAAGAAAVPVPTSPSSDDAIHGEMERLREMVLALSREVAIERAARDHLQQTVDAWEDREEPGDGEAAGAAGVSAPALSTPARQAQPQQFHVSPGAAVTEWGGSPTPAGLAAAQGWSAHVWADDAGWQDPWTQSADPWTSWSASWQQQDGRGWWGHAAPLNPPPGVVPAAASEQWADRADAQDDWLLKEAEGPLGSWSWPTQSQDWSWPASSYGWCAKTWSRDNSWDAKTWSRDNSWGPKHALDRKELDKPEKYGGDITKWAHWSGKLKRYLKLRCDPRWPQILQKIEAKKGQTMSKEEEDQLAYEFGLWDVEAWKS